MTVLTVPGTSSCPEGSPGELVGVGVGDLLQQQVRSARAEPDRETSGRPALGAPRRSGDAWIG
jgi:hypothetical protein